LHQTVQKWLKVVTRYVPHSEIEPIIYVRYVIEKVTLTLGKSLCLECPLSSTDACNTLVELEHKNGHWWRYF